MRSESRSKSRRTRAKNPNCFWYSSVPDRLLMNSSSRSALESCFSRASRSSRAFSAKVRSLTFASRSFVRSEKLLKCGCRCRLAFAECYPLLLQPAAERRKLFIPARLHLLLFSARADFFLSCRRLASSASSSFSFASNSLRRSRTKATTDHRLAVAVVTTPVTAAPKAVKRADEPRGEWSRKTHSNHCSPAGRGKFRREGPPICQGRRKSLGSLLGFAKDRRFGDRAQCDCQECTCIKGIGPCC